MKNLRYKKACYLFLVIISAIMMASCGQAKKSNEGAAGNKDSSIQAKSGGVAPVTDEFKHGQVYPDVACQVDASESYALFIPVTTNKTVPVIIMFDPHGSGNFVVTKYKNIAAEFGFALAASNSSKNGLPFAESQTIANNLVIDVMHRVPVDTAQVYMAGFSGGAKVAIAITKQNPAVHSVIYGGAAISLDESLHSFSLLGFAGVRDMNYSGLLQFDKEMDKTKFPHCLVEWSGKHEWADSAVYRKAFYWLAFDAMKRKVIPVNEELITHYEKEADAYNYNNSPLAQYERLKEKIAFLDGIKNTDDLKKSLANLSNDAKIKKLLDDKDKVMTTEQTLQEQYYKDLEEKNMEWWNAEINRMKNMKGDEGAMYQRLLGFVSLVCYSACQSVVQTNDDISSEKLLIIYKLADPENGDQRYFNAIFLARHGRDKDAIEQLKEAAKYGFEDKSKALSEKAFAPIMNDPDFQQAVSMMGAK